MYRITKTVIIAFVLVCSWALAIEASGPVQSGAAATPTVAASPQASATPRPYAATADLMLKLEGTSISWTPWAAAASYRLTGKLTATEQNASNVCGPTLGRQLVNLDVDETLVATASNFALTIPVLPTGESWLVSASFLEIVALTAANEPVGGSRIIVAAEGCRERAASPALPPTGSGGTNSSVGLSTYIASLLAGLSAVLGVGSILAYEKAHKCSSHKRERHTPRRSR